MLLLLPLLRSETPCTSVLVIDGNGNKSQPDDTRNNTVKDVFQLGGVTGPPQAETALDHAESDEAPA